MENLITNGKGIIATNIDGSWKIDANSGAVIIEDIIPHVGNSIAKGESIQTVFNELFNDILPRIPMIDHASMFKTDENGIDVEYPDVTDLNKNSIYIRITFLNSSTPLYISCWLLQSDIESLKDLINSKASKTEYDLLREEIESKVSSIQIDYLQEQINIKADKTALDKLQTIVDKKANSDHVAGLETAIYNKADKSALSDIENRINNINKTLSNYIDINALEEISGNITSINASLSKKADKTELNELSKTIENKADSSELIEINKKLENISSTNIEEVNTKLNSVTLSIDKINKKIDNNLSDIKKKADLSYVERIDTDLKKATTKLDIIVDTKADKVELMNKANKSDLESLTNTNVIINNNLTQLRKTVNSKVSKSDLDARINELQHTISDLYTVEKNDIRLVNSKLIGIEKNISKLDESVTNISKANKEWIQILTPEQYKRLPTSRIDASKLYMCVKYGKPYALYIGSVLIAERNVEESTGFAYTFPITF